MAVLGAEVYYDDAFVDGVAVPVGIRSHAFQLLGDLQVSGNLQVVAGCHPHPH